MDQAGALQHAAAAAGDKVRYLGSSLHSEDKVAGAQLACCLRGLAAQRGCEGRGRKGFFLPRLKHAGRC